MDANTIPLRIKYFILKSTTSFSVYEIGPPEMVCHDFINLWKPINLWKAIIGRMCLFSLFGYFKVITTVMLEGDNPNAKHFSQKILLCYINNIIAISTFLF